MEKLEKETAQIFFCMQESFFLESGEERIAASEGLICDAEKNLRKINHIYISCKYLSSKSKLYHPKV